MHMVGTMGKKQEGLDVLGATYTFWALGVCTMFSLVFIFESYKFNSENDFLCFEFWAWLYSLENIFEESIF